MLTTVFTGIHELRGFTHVTSQLLATLRMRVEGKEVPKRTIVASRDAVAPSPLRAIQLATEHLGRHLKGAQALFSIDIVSAPTFRYPTTPMWEQPMADLRSYDEDLVKPLILFADTITLRSERIDMLSLTDSTAFSISQMPMRRVMRFAAWSSSPDLDVLDALGLTPDVLADSADATSLRHAIKKGKGPDGFPMDALRKFEDKYRSQIFEVANAQLNTLRERRDSLTSPALASLAKSGLFTETGWSSAENSPFDLAWQEELEFLTSGIRDVEGYLKTSHGAVMLEPGSQFVFSDSQTEPSASSAMSLPARLASSFLSKLPGLESADLSELIDVRDDLKDYLVPFRASMTSMAKDVSEAAGEQPESLVLEIERRWSEEVSPVIHELGVKTRRGGYPRQLLSVLTQDKASLTSSAASISLAAGSVAAGLSTLIPAAVAASYPFIKALKETLEERETQQDNRLYFLYETNRRLSHDT